MSIECILLGSCFNWGFFNKFNWFQSFLKSGPAGRQNLVHFKI